MKEIKSWIDINVAQFVEYSETKIENFDTPEEYENSVLSIIFDAPMADIDNLPYDEYLSRFNQLDFLKTKPKAHALSKLEIAKTNLYLIDDLYKITIGEFIDLEYYFTDDYYKNLKLICAILYRQKTIHDSPFIQDVYEPYGTWIYHRSNLFDDISIQDVYGVIPKYLEFRDKIYTDYSGLFGEKKEEGEQEEETPVEELDMVAQAELIKEEKRQARYKKWAWDLILFELANNDPTKIEAATNIPMIQALNILSMKTELGMRS